MRALLVLLFLAPLAPEAQTLGADVGLVVVDALNEGLGYVEASAFVTQPVGSAAYVSARGALANAGFDCFDCGDLAESIRTLSIVAGVHRDLDGATVRAGAGPALSRILLSTGDDQTRLGLAAELGLDVYVASFVGFGLGIHGEATTSRSWVGVRFGARVRL